MWVSLHVISALAATAALGAGIAGLGRLLGGAELLARWVRGWTLLWWLVAVTASIAGPHIAAGVGSVALLAGLVSWALEARSRPRMLATGAAAIALGAPLFLLPPTFYDAMVYHLGTPWSWLANSSFAPVPHNLFGHFPLAVPVVNLLPLSWGLPEAAAGVHWLCLPVALVGAGRIARRSGAGRWSWLAPLLLIGCWHVVWVAGQPAADALVLVAFVAALDAVATRPEQPPRWLDLGLACGLAAAAKYPAVVPVAALLGGALIVRWRHWRPLVAAGAIATAAWSFVWIRNFVTTGNPVYPLLYSVFGGDGWSARDDARWAELVHQGVGGPTSILSGLERLVRPPLGLGWWFVPAAALAIVALYERGDEAPERRLLGTVAALALAGWLVTSQTTRYAFPLAAVVAVLAAVAVARLPKAVSIAAAALLGVGVLHGLIGLGSFTLGVQQIQRVWLGDIGAEQWRSAVTTNDPLPAYRLAGELLPAGSRLLVVGEGRPFGCPLPNHVSSPYDSQLVQEWVEEAAEPAAVARRIADAGFSHLLLNHGELQRLGGEGFQVLRWRDEADGERWESFLEGYTTRHSGQGPCELRTLRDQGSGIRGP